MAGVGAAGSDVLACHLPPELPQPAGLTQLTSEQGIPLVLCFLLIPEVGLPEAAR